MEKERRGDGALRREEREGVDLRRHDHEQRTGKVDAVRGKQPRDRGDREQYVVERDRITPERIHEAARNGVHRLHRDEDHGRRPDPIDRGDRAARYQRRRRDRDDERWDQQQPRESRDRREGCGCLAKLRDPSDRKTPEAIVTVRAQGYMAGTELRPVDCDVLEALS